MSKSLPSTPGEQPLPKPVPYWSTGSKHPSQTKARPPGKSTAIRARYVDQFLCNSIQNIKVFVNKRQIASIRLYDLIRAENQRENNIYDEPT